MHRALLLFGPLGLALAGGDAAAEIATDGTVGPRLELEGPEFGIGEELGTRAGDNLFHSFERFSLRSGESATFSGPDDDPERDQPGDRRRALRDRRHDRLDHAGRRFLLHQPGGRAVRPQRQPQRAGLVPRLDRGRAALRRRRGVQRQRPRRQQLLARGPGGVRLSRRRRRRDPGGGQPARPASNRRPDPVPHRWRSGGRERERDRRPTTCCSPLRRRPVRCR